MSVSTKTLLNQGEHRQKMESVRVPKNCPDQYEKMVDQSEDRNNFESRRVPAKDGIRASTVKLSGPVRKNG